MSENNEKDSRSVRIGRDFTLWQLILFAIPNILNNLFTQIFKTVDDGLFVSRHVSATALGAIKVLNPINCIQMAFANLFSIGASVLSSQRMGQGDREEANRILSRSLICAMIVGMVLTGTVFFFGEPLCRLMGADDTVLADTLKFARITYGNSPLHMA